MNTEKFQFDAVFHIEDNVDLVASGAQKKKFLAEEVEAIKRDAFQAGEQSAVAKAAEAAARAADQIGGRLEEVFSMLDQLSEELEKEAAELAFAIGRKIAGDALARHAEAPIKELAMKCLSNLRSVSHLEIRTPPDMHDRLRASIEDKLSESDVASRVVFTADDALAQADCRLVWDQGELAREHAALEKEIQQALDNYFATRGPSQGAAEHDGDVR